MHYTTLTAALALLTLTRPALAADPLLDLRLVRPGTAPVTSEQTLSDLVLQIQALQKEVAELRGLVEMQQYQLQQMQSGTAPRFDSAPRLGGGAIDAGLDPLPRPDPNAPGGTAPPAPTAVPGTLPPLAPTPPRDLPTSGLLGLPAPEVTANAESRGLRPGSGLLALPAPEGLAGGEREAYRGAFDALKERDYPNARKGFETLLRAYPEGEFADSARYWLGEIGYVTQDYSTALAQFNRLVTDFPTSPKVPTALLKVGYVHFERKDLDQARAVLQEVVTRYPESTEASLARGRLERMGE